VLHEVGLAEGAPLLAEATPEQVQIVLDFALWERDRIGDGPLGEWLEALSVAPPERIGDWLAGLDSELVGLILRRGARIYDLSQEEPPEEPEGIAYPTPDRLFVLDVHAGAQGGAPGEEHDPAAALIRLVDSLYRADRTLARRMLVAARAELDSELEESAYRWRQARMSDLGFADYYEALEVYSELDPAGVSVEDGGAGPEAPRPAPRGDVRDDALRVPTALAERLRDTAASPFARAAQKIGDARAVEELRAALVALTNRVLAADRVAPGDDVAVGATLERMAATLDLAIERLAAGDDERGAQALRSLPLVRVFRLGFSLTGRVRRLALALRAEGPFGPRGFELAEPDDAAVLEAVTAARPMFPRILEDRPAAGERPFRTLADVARAAAAVERAAAAQALLRGLGVTPADLAPESELLHGAGADHAALDLGVFARTALAARLLRPAITHADRLSPLEAREVKELDAPVLSEKLRQRAGAILADATPAGLGPAAQAVIDRWIRSLAPLETTLVHAPDHPRPGSRPRARRR